MKVGVTQTCKQNSVQKKNYIFKVLKTSAVYLSLANGNQELSDEKCMLSLLMMSPVYFFMFMY